MSKLEDCIESVFIEIDKNSLNLFKNVVIGTVYRPPNTDIYTFNNYITEILNRLKNENKFVYIMGDYNINLLNTDTIYPRQNFLRQYIHTPLFH